MMILGRLICRATEEKDEFNVEGIDLTLPLHGSDRRGLAL